MSDSAHSETPKPRLALPDRETASTSDGSRVLNVDGATVSLDELGPMIINSNGTVSRISNWSSLSKIEQDRAVRLLVKKRNVERLKVLQAEDAEKEKASEAAEAAEKVDKAD